MPKRSKIIAYAVIALAVVWVGGRIVKRAQPAYVKWKLKRELRDIEPWSSSTNYSASGWEHLIRAAGAFQRADPQLAEDVLEEHLRNSAGNPDQMSSEQGKLFLLLRMVFDLPEHAPARGRIFDGWARGQSDLNADGTVNAAWPVSVDQGKPRLVAGREGAGGGGYSVRDEYTFLRYRFKYRDLSGIHVEG